MPAPQLVANQANAQLSTGPVTAEGKTRSARNALRHGLTAKNPLLPEEDREEYKRHCETYLARFAWRDECERQLIQRMADIEWRLLRVPHIEAALVEEGEFGALANIAMYEQRLQRTKEKALAHLRELQASRSKEEIKNGFVFSKPAPSKIFCGRCFTESDQKKVCEHCGSKNHLMTEEEFDFRHPMEVDSDGNVIFADASISATASQLSLSFDSESFIRGRESADLSKDSHSPTDLPLTGAISPAPLSPPMVRE